MLVAIALVAFLSLGLPDGMLGVAWPSIRRTFDLGPGALGALLATATVGYLLSSFTSGALVARLGVGRLLLGSSGLLVVNALALAASPAWRLTVAAGLLAGLGAGAIDAGINTVAAARFSPRLVSWLHAAYALGAMLGPLLMTGAVTSGLGWRWGYGLLGILLALMSIGFLVTVRRWDTEAPVAAAARQPPIRLPDALARQPVRANVALFFVYAGLEVSAGQWAYTLFTDGRAVAPQVAGAAVAAYWAGLGAGRLVSGALAARVAAGALMRRATLGALAASVLIAWDPGPGAGLLGLAALGFALAPVYPTLIAETPARVGSRHTPSAIGFQVAASYLGTAAIPGLTGLLAGWAGLEAIALCLVGNAAALFLLDATTRRTIAIAQGGGILPHRLAGPDLPAGPEARRAR